MTDVVARTLTRHRGFWQCTSTDRPIRGTTRWSQISLRHFDWGIPAGDGTFDAEALGLPSEPAAIVRYLTHRYRGVGEKTAEALVERFGAGLFTVLKDDPEAIAAAVTPKRAEQVLEAWKIDFERRSGRRGGGTSGSGEAPEPRSGSSDRSRRGGRRRGPRGRGAS